MNISKNGLNLIESFEGLKLSPYLDSAGIPTIGYGTICYQNGTRVTMDDSAISQNQALVLLEWQVNQKTTAINNLVRVSISQNQFDALASFTYNEGIGALQTSSLLRLLNAGNTTAAADQFLVWDKARVDGQLVEVDGLLRRRQAERALFLGPVV